MPIRNIVFLHGWGLNSKVWVDFIERFQNAEPTINVHLIDIAGYGSQAKFASSSDLSQLSADCLSRAPEQAFWVGWSLGGMIALKAALAENHVVKPRIQGLQLISTTPRFAKASDWLDGVPIESFQRFCDAFSENYQRALIKFLAMQAGADKNAQAIAYKAHADICTQPSPSPQTLQLGIDCLGTHNMLDEIKPLGIPAQVVCGSLDRVVHPQSAKILADLLDCELVTLKTGHAPFLTNPQRTLGNLQAFLGLIERASV